MKKNIFGLLVSILFCTSIHAQTFTFDGIKYKVTDTNSNYVEVGDNTSFSGVANIPNTVTYDSIDYTVTAIGEFAFYNSTGLTSVTIPNSITSIGSSAFAFTGLTSVTIPDSVTAIGTSTFRYCTGLTSVTIGNSVSAISEDAFAYCTSLASVTIGSSVTNIGNYAFYNCEGLTSVTIPDSVTAIGNYVFADCSGLTSVTIPDSVTAIGDGAFGGCIGLTSVTIGNSVTAIGAYVFGGCTSLTSVTSLNPTPPTVAGTNAFDAATYAGTLYVPAGSESAYNDAAVWEDFNGAVLSIEQLNEVTVMVYPNPVVETLYIQLQPNDILTSVTLHTIKGQKILESTTNTLDLSSLTNGVYFLTILTNNGSSTKKIIK